MEKQTIKIHRVGSVTFGAVLVVLGILFLLRLFVPKLEYEVIFHFWPLILIFLGIEVLLGNRHQTYEVRDEAGKLLEQSRVVYDVAAIILTMVLTGFSMVMGIIDWAFHYSQHIYF